MEGLIFLSYIFLSYIFLSYIFLSYIFLSYIFLSGSTMIRFSHHNPLPRHQPFGA